MKITYMFLIIIGISALIMYIGITYHHFFYTFDLMTHDKPCIGIGEYCSYYTEDSHCYVGSDYVICDIIGDGIGYD